MRSIKELEKIILFGAGSGAIYRYFTEFYSEKVMLVVDNDSLKWGEGTFKVFPPSELEKYRDREDVRIVITTYKYWDEILTQLQENGWKREIIVAYRDLIEFKEIEFKLFERGIDAKNPEPITCMVELSGICNCKCVYCCYHGVQNIKKEKKGLMSWDTLRETVARLKNIPSLKNILIAGAGETFVHPEWYEMTKFVIDSLNCERLIMCTNGMLLTKSNIEKILRLPVAKELTISIDGMSPEDNDYYRIGSNYERIKENIHILLKMKEKWESDLNIIIRNCYPITKKAYDEKQGIINPCFSAEVPLYLKRDFPELPITSSYTIVYEDDNHKEPSNSLHYYNARMPYENAYCLSPFAEMAIDNEGCLLRCACGVAGIECFGNVYDDDVYELWKNDEIMMRTRNSFLNRDDDKPFCFGCPQKGPCEYWLYTEDDDM